MPKSSTKKIREELKEILKKLIEEPVDAEYLPICQDAALRALCHRCEHILGSTGSASDRALQVLEVVLLSLVIDSLGDHRVAGKSTRPLILFWHKYYGLPGSGSVPSDAKVAESLGNKEVVEQLLSGISRRIEESREYLGESEKRQPDTVSMSDILDPLVHQFHEIPRRSVNDLINEASTLLANELYRRAPQVFEKPKVIAPRSTGVPAHLLEILRGYILEQCAHLPQVDGYGPSMACYIPRSFKTDIVRGSPVVPCSTRQPPELARLSGVLTGVPGSGRTAFLKYAAYSFVTNQPLNGDSCFAFYISARDLLAYARVRRSVYDYIADRVFESQEVSQADAAAFRRWVEAQDKDCRLLLLVDDLDRLSEADRGEVVSQLVFCNAVTCATVPWQADEVISLMSRQPHLARYELVDLSIDQQQELLVRLAREYPEQAFDLALAHWMLEEVPFLTALPLGVLVVYAQALHCPGNQAMTAQRALEVWFERAELRPPQFACKNYRDEPMAYALMYLVQMITQEMYNRAEHPTDSKGCEMDFVITRARCDRRPEYERKGFDFDLLMPTGLFLPVEGPDALCFVNRDIMYYCIALAIHHEWTDLKRPPSWWSQTAFAQIVQRIESYRVAMWESSFEGFS